MRTTATSPSRRASSRAASSSLALLLALAACDLPAGMVGGRVDDRASPPSPASRGLAVLELASSPSAASVFLDGRYAGETAPEGPLRIAREAGPLQLRVSARGHADLVAAVVLEPGRALRVRAELAAAGSGPSSPSGEVRIGVGQVVRGELGAAGDEHVLAFEGRAGTRRDVVLHGAAGEVELRVLDPDGDEVALGPDETVTGNPPEVRRARLELAEDGLWRIRVRCVRPGRGLYVLALEKSPPPEFEGETGTVFRRRLPGAPE